MIEFLVWFVACFISTFGIVYLYSKLTNLKLILLKKYFVVFLIGVFIATLIRFFNLNFLSFLSYFIFYPFLFYILNSSSLKKSIYYTVLIWIIGAVLDFVIMLFLSLLNYIFCIDLTTKIYTILPSFLVFLIFALLSNSKKICNLINKIVVYLYKIYFFDFLLLCLICFLISLGIAITININNLTTEFLLIIINFLLLYCILLLMQKKINDFENKIFLNFLKDNNNFYIKVDQENRIFKHNLMANLLCIKSVSNKKTRMLIDDFLIKNNFNIDFTSHIRQIPYGINGIISEKIYPYIDKLDIKINNEIDYDIFEFLNPRRYNVFTEKMIVALDNAIESALHTKEKLLIVNLYEESEKICIEIKNSYSNEINVDNIGIISCSTKGKKRGLGLLSLFRDKEAQVKLKIINNVFISIISAKKRT